VTGRIAVGGSSSPVENPNPNEPAGSRTGRPGEARPAFRALASDTKAEAVREKQH
jgi:hypothetical protein